MPQKNINPNDDINLEQLLDMHPDHLRALKFGLMERLSDVLRQKEPTLCDQCRRGRQSAHQVKAP